MANAHLPNCHPDVTPDWFQETFSRTTYLEAIQTSLVEGFDGGRYQGYVQPGWCSSAGRQLAAHGGYCVGALMTTCQQFFAKQHGDMNQPDCIGVHVEFLAPVPQGNYHVTVKDVALGGRQSVVEACIVSSDIRRPKTYIIGLVRMGRLIEDKEAPGIPIPTTHIPDRVLECTRVTNANYYRASPATATVRIFSPKDGVSSMWSPVFGGQKCRDRWHKMDDETLFETEHLPLIADLIPAIPLNYEKDLSTIFQWRMPTTSLTPDIKSDPRGNEWLLTRAAMRRFYNGRFDMDIKIIDDGGNIIATCTQACLAIPAKVSKSKGKGEKL